MYSENLRKTKMTAFESYEYDAEGKVTAVRPALPQEIWAGKVFEYMDTLNSEMIRFEELRQQDGDLNLDDGSTYVEGYEDSVTTLRERFLEIFDVVGTIR